MKREHLLVYCLTFFVGLGSAAADPAEEQIGRAFSQVTGLTARSSDIASLRSQATSNGALSEDLLFTKLFEDPNFVTVRLSTIASRMSNEDGEPFENVDDFQVALILAITSNIDLRDLLTKHFFIEAVGNPGKPIEPSKSIYAIGKGRLLTDYLDIPQKLRLNFSELANTTVTSGYYAEGLMTTQGFGIRSLKAGTNRRAIRAAFDLFLCSKIDTWKDTSLDDFYVGRDVDRKPGENPEAYQTICRGCHAPMDAMRGALANYDYDPNMDRVTYSPSVGKKYNQNKTVFPGGFQTINAQWENLLSYDANIQKFGWRGNTSGTGLLSFSTMLANSRQFQSCMAKRVASAICELDASEMPSLIRKPEFQRIVDGFRDDGYRTKALIRKIVTSGLCLR